MSTVSDVLEGPFIVAGRLACIEEQMWLKPSSLAIRMLTIKDMQLLN